MTNLVRIQTENRSLNIGEPVYFDSDGQIKYAEIFERYDAYVEDINRNSDGEQMDVLLSLTDEAMTLHKYNRFQVFNYKVPKPVKFKVE